jgi:HK97 family phage major capsid protein
MSKQLKAILAKAVADLTEVEKALLVKCSAELSAEEKTKFAEVLKADGEAEDEDADEEDEDIDVESLKKILNEKTDESIEKRTDAIAERIVDKFFKGASNARAKILEKGETKSEKEKKSDAITRDFMKALINRDYARAKALTTTTPAGASPDDANAGISIPTDLLAEVLRFIPLYGLARRKMRYLPFGGPGNSRNITALAASVKVFWTGESAKKKSTQPKFSPVIQTLKKLAAICPMTEEILEDSLIPLNSLLGELFAEAIGVEEDYQFLAGVGAPWTGILNNGSVNFTYQKVAGTANIDADDMLNMKVGLPAAARTSAEYYFNPDTEVLLQQLKDKDGRYILQMPVDDAPGKLWGRPYNLTDALPAPTAVAAGDPWIIFGDLKKCAILGDKQQIRVKILEEATITDTDDQTSINLGEQDEVAIRVVERVGYVLALPQGISVLKNEEDSGS